VSFLDELRSILGEDNAQRFLAVFARTDVNVPKLQRGPFFAELQRVVGEEPAERFRKHFAGQTLYVPRNVFEERERRNAEIVARYAAGESLHAIARSYRSITSLSVRQVRRIATGTTKTDVTVRKLSSA
jgi:hypothetical protein